MRDNVLYEEKQFLGHNKSSILIRSVLALFCFLGYYWSENPKPVKISVIQIGSYPVQSIPDSGRIFFMLGLCILVISALLIYVLHTYIRVYENFLIVDGFWNARRVKIDLRNVYSIKKMKYKKSLLRRPVYNLHFRGIIKFYTSGEEFLEIKDKDGMIYRIGTQRSAEFFKVVNRQIQSF